ncbi:MAG: hypothetical protein JNK65_04685 [Deltaproteobacteria bacterium]|nr:hypothetical protein [Deltaproteobacteria bacterium]
MPIYKNMPHKHHKPNEPDEFLSFFDKLYHKIYAQGPIALATLGVFVLVGLGVFFWRSFHTNQADKLAQTLFDASKQGKEAEIKIYNDIKKANPYSPMGIYSSLQIASFDMTELKCDEVLNQLNPYVGYTTNPVLVTMIYSNVGICLENKKDFKAASDHYEKAQNDSYNLLRDWSSLRLAFVKKDLGDSQTALKIFKDLSDPESKATPAVKELARAEIEKLNLASETKPESSQG